MFTILRIYQDWTSQTETAPTFACALSACAIYIEDPECWGIEIWNTNNGEIYLNYWKEN